MKGKRTDRVWVLCEAFCLTCDHTTIHDSMTPYAVVCADKRACVKALKKCVTDSVKANYFGLDDDDVEERIASDVKDILDRPKKLGRGIWQYNYSADDREIYWRMYPTEVKDTKGMKGAK